MVTLKRDRIMLLAFQILWFANSIFASTLYITCIICVCHSCFENGYQLEQIDYPNTMDPWREDNA